MYLSPLMRQYLTMMMGGAPGSADPATAPMADAAPKIGASVAPGPSQAYAPFMAGPSMPGSGGGGSGIFSGLLSNPGMMQQLMGASANNGGGGQSGSGLFGNLFGMLGGGGNTAGIPGGSVGAGGIGDFSAAMPFLSGAGSSAGGDAAAGDIASMFAGMY